jgi:O-antigen ligase
MTTVNWIKRTDRKLRLAGYWLVISLALLVPLFDRQPVNILALLLAITVGMHLSLKGRGFYQDWHAIDWTVLALLISAILSTAFGWPSAGGYQGIAESLGYFTLFHAITHGGYGKARIVWLGVAAIVGTLIAVTFTLTFHFANGTPFQLPGVAGTIRSSLYTGIALMLCVGFTLQSAGIQRLLWLATTVFLFAMLLSMTSRGVMLTVVLCLLIGLFARFRLRALKYVLMTAVLVAVAVAMMPNTMYGQMKGKATELAELVVKGKVSANDQVRIEIWRVALAWMGRGEHVLLGIGPRNYHLIDAEQLQLSPPVRFEETIHISHAHNLFFTRYIEQGLFGLLTLLALFVLIARELIRDGVARRMGWAWWGALGGLLLPLVSGLFNSPWNRDYAWLAIFTFALYLALRQEEAAGPTSSPA